MNSLLVEVFQYSETSHSEHLFIVNLFSRSHFSVYFTLREITRFVLGEHPSTVNSEHFLRSQVLYFMLKKHLYLVNTAIFPNMFISTCCPIKPAHGFCHSRPGLLKAHSAMFV